MKVIPTGKRPENTEAVSDYKMQQKQSIVLDL